MLKFRRPCDRRPIAAAAFFTKPAEASVVVVAAIGILGLFSDAVRGKIAVPLKDIGSEIDFAGTVGTYLLTDAANGAQPELKAWGNYWLFGASMPFALGKVTKLTVGWAYTEGNSAYFKQGSAPKSINTEAVGRGVATVSVAFTF